MSIDQLVARHYAGGDLGSASVARSGRQERQPAEHGRPRTRGRVPRARPPGDRGAGPGARIGRRPAGARRGLGIGGPSRYVAATYVRGGGDRPDRGFLSCRGPAGGPGRARRPGRVPSGNALAMPFDDASFEAAYTQHVAMNIEDKGRLYAEVGRVLKPGGRFGIYDLPQETAARWSIRCPGRATPRPAAWCARTNSAPPRGRRVRILSWRDTAAEARHLGADQARMARATRNRMPCGTVVGDDAGTIGGNIFRNCSKTGGANER